MKIFTAIVAGLSWFGKELVAAPSWIKKVVTVTDDVEQDAETLLPQTVTLIEDVDGLVTSAVKDSGAALTALEALTQSLVVAAQADAVNFADDEDVLVKFKAFAAAAVSGNYADVIAAEKKLVVDFDAFKGSAAAALQKLEADV